jgi:hypothetical protein
MQDTQKQRPHFPRILDSRRRAQEQSNAGLPKKREAPAAGQRAASAAQAHEDAPSATRGEEQN